MTDFAEPGTLAPTGLYLGGTKYMVIQGEPGAVIRGKKVSILQHIHVCSYVTDEFAPAYFPRWSVTALCTVCLLTFLIFNHIRLITSVLLFWSITVLLEVLWLLSVIVDWFVDDAVSFTSILLCNELSLQVMYNTINHSIQKSLVLIILSHMQFPTFMLDGAL